MIVYRITKGKYAPDLSGKGAEMHGGRWNSKGVAMLYTSDSRSLAFAEVYMHIPAGIIPKDYHLISIEVPDSIDMLKLSVADMPPDWRLHPHANSTQMIGDQFILESKYLAMRVPSAIVPGDYNYLFNPVFPLMTEVKIVMVEPFEFDSRLAGKT